MTETEKTAAYESDSEQARARIASTVDDIQDRLSPRRIIGDAASDLQDRGSALFESGARLVREHPVAVSLIGLSLGLLLLKRDSATPKGDAYEDVYGEDDAEDGDDEPGAVRRAAERAKSAAASAKSTVAETAAAARDYASETLSSARERTADYAAKAKEGLDSAKQRAADGLDGNPLAGAVIGIAAGALVGALIPRTEREDALLGETREHLAARAKAAAKAAIDAGKRELDERGLNLDAARAKLGEFGEQAKTIARNAGQAAADNLKASPPAGHA